MFDSTPYLRIFVTFSDGFFGSSQSKDREGKEGVEQEGVEKGTLPDVGRCSAG
jgi:hypothetical protein